MKRQGEQQIGLYLAIPDLKSMMLKWANDIINLPDYYFGQHWIMGVLPDKGIFVKIC